MLTDYSDTAVLQIRDAIDAARGNEVFFLGTTGMEKQVLSVEVLARGSKDAVPAILQACTHGDVVIHNHPSGDPEPSREDILLTDRLKDVGRLVGIHVLDHIIIGDNRYYSFVDQGLI